MRRMAAALVLAMLGCVSPGLDFTINDVRRAQNKAELSQVFGREPKSCEPHGPGEERCVWERPIKEDNPDGTQPFGARYNDAMAGNRLLMICDLPESGPRPRDGCRLDVRR